MNRPRGLCWSCYYAPGVRDRYPSTSKYARRGAGNGFGGGAMPTPTAALPGTPEKLAVLAGRAARKERLWHPLDADYDPMGRFLETVVGAAPTRGEGDDDDPED